MQAGFGGKSNAARCRVRRDGDGGRRCRFALWLRVLQGLGVSTPERRSGCGARAIGMDEPGKPIFRSKPRGANAGFLQSEHARLAAPARPRAHRFYIFLGHSGQQRWK